MNLTQITCPYCHSEMNKAIKSYKTKHNGTRQLHKCEQCHKVFSETKGSFLEGLVKPISLIAKVLQARHEGMGLNAACRVFNIAKNTLLSWEKNSLNCKRL